MRFARLVSWFVAAGLVLAASYSTARAEEKTKEQLTQESIEKCRETASTAPTPAMIVAKVQEACDLIAKEGEAAFPKFRGKDSPFIFAGTYCWIHRLNDTTTLVHPTNPKTEGRDLSMLHDATGKAFFVEMNELVQKDGHGWVEYQWPKPGEKQPSLKISYVQGVKSGDTQYVVGCGVYGLTMEQVKKELEGK